MGLTDEEKKDLSERRLEDLPNQGPDAKSPPLNRNQPSKNGYYYAPDEAARTPIDAWLEDDIDAGIRYARCVVTNYPPAQPPNDTSPHHVTVLRVAITDSWYVQDAGDGGGRNFDKSLFKGTDMLEAMLLLRKLVLTAPPFPQKG